MASNETSEPNGSLPNSLPSEEKQESLQNPTDLEAQAASKNREESPKDPNLVTWNGPVDPENPKNWPDNVKWKFTVGVSLFTFISPVSSSMVAPAIAQLGSDLRMKSQFEEELALSIFILAYAIGPFFFGPYSEVYGRKRLLQVSNLWYFAWNLACGFAQTEAQFFVFRFLAGLGGSAPLAVGGGAIGDIWTAEQRGRAMGIYTLAPILGPVLGPVAGGWIAEYSTWRWVFWSSSIAAMVVQIYGIFGLQESHGATLLRQKKDRLIKETGNNDLYLGGDADLPFRSKILIAVSRPIRMFCTQPIVMLISTYMAYIFGLNYLFIATFPEVWSGVYNESLGIAGLNYIPIGIGAFVGLLGNFFLIDRIYKGLKARNDGVGRPEFRIPTMLIGSPLVTVGLFWYGWAVQNRVFWVVPNLGIIVFTAGSIICLAGMQTFIVDIYTRYAASAFAAAAIVRSLAGFGFPLFAPYLYRDLGYGWGTSVLAFISIGLGWTAPVIFWVFGEALRKRSKYAAGE
ncbi:major facilitator superfamily domain-containing protein [Xylariales sp. PMI_506]|nr:major facilitator superfamily domain-containing protein [Xylariales sp. PMI_506]